MKRVYIMIGVFMVALMALGLLFVSISQTASVAGALKQLGGGEGEYEHVRKKVLFTMGDPAPALYQFLASPSTSRTARLHALRLLEELAGHQDLTGGGAAVAALVEDTSAELQLQALKTLATMESMAGIQPVIALYYAADDTAVAGQCYRTLKATAEPLRQTIDAAVRLVDSARVDSCAKVADSFPVNKGTFLAKLARYYHSRGDYQRAASYYRRMGVPACWWVVGEFSMTRPNDPDKEHIPYEPETRPFDPNDTFRLSDGFTTRWFALQRISGWGDINIRPLFSRQDNTLAYFHTFVHVPSARKAYLYYMTDDRGKVWLNDSLVTLTPGYQGYSTNEDVVRISLRAGVNALRVKVLNDSWGWSLFVRVADSTGEGMSDVAFSLSPQPTAHLVDTVISRASAGNAGWESLLDSVVAEDHAVASRIVNVIVDRGEAERRRIGALRTLAKLNTRRKVPVGEQELIQLGEGMGRSGRPSELLNCIAGVLAEMGTTRALDLGLALRDMEGAAAKRGGHALVNAFCRTRIQGLGRLADRSRRAEIFRAVSDIASLRTTDPWVLHQQAAFMLETGDSSQARALVAPCHMPNRWVVRKLSCSPKAIGLTTSLPAVGPRVDSALSTGVLKEPVDGWRPLDTASGDPMGMHAKLVPDDTSRRTGSVYALHTTVSADRADSVLVGLTLPAPHVLWVNGRKIGGDPDPAVARYDYGEIYKYERLRYDADRYAVALNEGPNAITILFVDAWVTDGSLHRFRLGFADLEGRPVAVANGVLQL